MGNYKILNQNICFEDAVAAKNTAVSLNVLSKAIFPNSAELLFYIFLKLCRLGNIKFSCSIMGIQLRDAAEIDFFYQLNLPDTSHMQFLYFYKILG